MKSAFKLNILNKQETVSSPKNSLDNEFNKNESLNLENLNEAETSKKTMKKSFTNSNFKSNKTTESINMQLSYSQSTLKPMPLNPSRLLGSFEVF